eukprot:403364502
MSNFSNENKSVSNHFPSDTKSKFGSSSTQTVKQLLTKKVGDEEAPSVSSNLVLKKREDFAVTLRKQKHDALLQSKRRANMQQVFERTMRSMSQNGGNLSNSNRMNDVNDFIEIKDVNQLNQMVHYLGMPNSNAEERLRVLRSIRNLTVTHSQNTPYYYLVENTNCVNSVMTILEDRTVDFQSKSECLWIISNLACENKVCLAMVEKFGIVAILVTLIETYFIKNSQYSNEIHSTQPLSVEELGLLEQMLWCVANISSGSKKTSILFVERKFDKYLSIIVRDRAPYLNSETWRACIWAFANLSEVVSLTFDKEFEVVANFVNVYWQTAIEVINIDAETSEEVKLNAKQDSLRLFENLFVQAEEEELHALGIMHHVKLYVFDSLKDCDLRYSSSCIRILGNLFCLDDTLVNQLIQQGLLTVLDKILGCASKKDKKEALWLISNMAANSEQDSESIILSSISFKLIMLTKDDQYDLRKEASWAISNFCQKATKSILFENLMDKCILDQMISLIQRDGDSGSMMMLVLTAIKNCVTKSEACKERFYLLQGLEEIEGQQYSAYSEIYELATEILERVYDCQQVDEIEKMKYINSIDNNDFII